MGGLKQDLNINRYSALLCKYFENVIKKCIKEYDDEGTNLNINILKQGNNSHSMVVNTSNLLKVCHQNIRGLFGKTEELLCSLLFDLPHIICLTEHQLNEYEINNILLDNYVMGAKYCRIIHKNGGVCIFIHSSIKFNNVSVAKYCVEKDIEPVQLN
jgi:hypothetical protein